MVWRRWGAGPVLCAASAVAVGVASGLPWAASGARRRSSYELVAVAERLDVLEGVTASASGAWRALPLLVVLTCIAVLFRRALATAIISLCVGSAALGLVVAVIRSPLGVEPGAQLGLVSGAGCVVGAVVVLVEQRRGP